MRVEPKTIGIVAVTHNPHATRSTQFEGQTDPFMEIASGQAYPVVTSILKTLNNRKIIRKTQKTATYWKPKEH